MDMGTEFAIRNGGIDSDRRQKIEDTSASLSEGEKGPFTNGPIGRN